MSKSDDFSFSPEQFAFRNAHISKAHIKPHDLVLDAMFSPDQVNLIEEVLDDHATDAADSFRVANDEDQSRDVRLRMLLNGIRAQNNCDEIYTALYERRAAIEKLMWAQSRDEYQRKQRIG